MHEGEISNRAKSAKIPYGSLGTKSFQDEREECETIVDTDQKESVYVMPHHSHSSIIQFNLYYLCAESTVTRAITDRAQYRYT
jgi:hypothetical protein